MNAVLVGPHLRNVRTAAKRHRHAHIEQADGQYSGNDLAALLKVDHNDGCGQVGLIFLLISSVIFVINITISTKGR